MSEQTIEEMIQAKDLNAPRLTPNAIEEQIVGEQYHQWDGSNATACLLTLKNDFTVQGYSSCVSDANFDAEIGKSVAREDAKRQIWALEGYRLKESLTSGS